MLNGSTAAKLDARAKQDESVQILESIPGVGPRTAETVTAYLGEPKRLREVLVGLEFDALINTAAQTNVDRCETDQEEAFALNGEAPGVLAEICAQKRAPFIHVSTDYVFDGEKREPYAEEDEARPVSVYGESKREGERRALAANDRALVVRVSWVFGPDRPSFVDWAIGQAREREEVKAIADKWATPTYTLDLAGWLKPLIVNPLAVTETS